MSSPTLSQEKVERAIAAATALQEQDSLMPHTVIDDLVGLEAYRRFMRCPDLETLAAFAEDALPFEQALEIAAHEARCPVCATDVQDLRRAMRQQVGQLLAAAPQWATPFVGREAPRRSLSAAFADGDHSLVTLSAPAGTGKTRLALETAMEEAYLFPDGVWSLSAAAADTEPQAACDIACAIHLPLQGSASPLQQLQSFFAPRRALLILDDVDASSSTTAVIAQLTASAPNLRCLSTSRQPLGLKDEQILALPPMQTPRPTRDPSSLLDWESMQLFTAYTQEILPGYRFNEDETLSAAGICERAAGLPLSIELAAARMRAMPPQEVLRQLDAGNIPPDRPGESLLALLQWSYGLLSRREQAFLQQLSVFTESFLIEQAAEICRTDDAFDLVERLHQNALLERWMVSGQDRYRLPAAIRRFASDRLGTLAEEARRRHATYFLRSAREQADLLEGKRQVEAMRQIADDLPNLRAAMDWAQSAGEWRSVGLFGLSLNSFLMFSGCWQECNQRLRVSVDAFERAEAQERYHQAQLALARCLIKTSAFAEAESLLMEVRTEFAWQDPTPELAEAYRGLGNAAQLQGRYAEATSLLTEAMQRFDKLGDRRNVAVCRQNLGWIAWQLYDYERAERYLKGCLPTLRESGDRNLLGTTLAVLGNVIYEQGRLEEAHQLFEEALQVRRELGDVRGIASSITNMGMVWQAQGDYRRADYCYALAARQLESLGDRRTLGQVWMSQGETALARGDLALARSHFEASCRMLEEIGDAPNLAQARVGLGRVTQQEGALDAAARLYRDSLAALDRQGDQRGAALVLHRLAELLQMRGETERAYLLLNVALTHIPQQRPMERAEIEATRQQWEERLPEEQILSLREQAAAMPLTLAIKSLEIFD